MAEIGRGAQVTLTGASQGAARGAISPTLTGNTDARNAATPVDNYGTPAPFAGSGAAMTRTLDIWNRATDEEAAIIQGELETTSPRAAGRFGAAQYLDHSDEDFTMLRNMMVAIFGQERADVLLAPSDEGG